MGPTVSRCTYVAFAGSCGLMRQMAWPIEIGPPRSSTGPQSQQSRHPVIVFPLCCEISAVFVQNGIWITVGIWCLQGTPCNRRDVKLCCECIWNDPERDLELPANKLVGPYDFVSFLGIPLMFVLMVIHTNCIVYSLVSLES